MKKRLSLGILYGLVFLALLVLSPSADGESSKEGGDSPSSAAERSRPLWSLAFLWENDSLARTDRFYTNGIGIALTQTGKNGLDPLTDRLPWAKGRRTVGYAFYQLMFTPADTTRTIPDPNDRPYAGILAFDLSMHVEKKDVYHGLKVMIGVIGPSSGAGSAQREVHRLLDRRQPEGWEYQLKDEPLLNFFYEYRRKFLLAGKTRYWELEGLPVVGGSLGNFRIQGTLGLILRMGYRIPKDFGPGILRGMGSLPPPEGSDWGFSIYGGPFINAVLRDITLDGNTFTDSPRVEKEFLVPAVGSGIVISHRRFRFAFSYVFLGKEFKGQKDYARFGAFSLYLYF